MAEIRAEQGPLGWTMLERLEELKQLPTGKRHATRYHHLVTELLAFIFDWCLDGWKTEARMDGDRSRIDILCDNVATTGYMAELRTLLHAFTIPIECKNYSTALGNAEFNQLNDRLGKRTSRIGFLFCRRIQNLRRMRAQQADRYFRFENLILVFDDEAVDHMLRLRLHGDYAGIEALIREQVTAISYRTYA